MMVGRWAMKASTSCSVIPFMEKGDGGGWNEVAGRGGLSLTPGAGREDINQANCSELQFRQSLD